MYIFSKPYSKYPRSRKIEAVIPESEGRRIFVYQLRDDGNDVPFYVGKGMGNRPVCHFGGHILSRDVSAKSRHIKKMMDQGKDIFIDIIEFFDDPKEAFALELKMIAQYGKKCDGTGVLLNLTDGGDCGPTFTNQKLYINKAGVIKWFKEDPKGEWVTYSIRGKICIEFLHNGHKTFINEHEFDPLIHKKSGLLTGYKVYSDGITIIKLPANQLPPEGFFPSSPVKGKVRINNGVINTFMKKGELLPEGFSYGLADFTRTTKGKVPLTNGIDSITINKGDPIPEGYYHRNKGQKFITDGKTTRKLREGDEVPEGWKLGSCRSSMHIITDGKQRKWVCKTEPLPHGWILLKRKQKNQEE